MSAFWSFFFVALFVIWAAAEIYALKTGRETLSRYVWNLTAVFPLLPFIVGLVVGGLAVHFFWGGVICFAPSGG